MNFRTQLPVKKTDIQIDYLSSIFSIGSCFAENMAQKFDYFKITNLSNPFGILFHPLAIEKVLQKTVQKIPFNENDIFFHNELYHCFDVHSEFSHSDKNIFLQNLNQTLLKTKSFLEKSNYIIITLGTSWVYIFKEKNEIVANCHKVPQKEFSKELLSVEQIAKSLENIVSLFPDQKIIFTISPVRHIKDGFAENTVSKSLLFVGLSEVLKKHHNTHYFPSYEIMMDELRDYRFYQADMLHPNSVAIDYIWQRFSENYFSDEALKRAKDIDSIRKALNHKPFNSETINHQKFLESTHQKIRDLGFKPEDFIE
jgi:hypothetical protein